MRRLCALLLLAAMLMSLSATCMAQERAADVPAASGSCGVREPGDTRPRIGLALGGGGARGIAHVRILKKLEEMRIPVDCIAGTSMGALVGALYATGKDAGEIEALLQTIEWKQLFTDSLPRRDRSLRRKDEDATRLATLGVGIQGSKGLKLAPGFSEGERLIAFFENQTGSGRINGDFDRLPIPFRAVATDINTGKHVVLGDGSLPMAMRASMSLPGIFRPVEIDGKILVDGGLADQVPIDVVRQMGADRVIAVDVGTPLSVLDRDASLVDVLDQMSGFLTTGSAARQLATLGPSDVLITPDLTGQVSTGDFEKADLALQIGQAAADAASAALAPLSVAPDQYARFEARHKFTPFEPPRISAIRFENHTGYADEVLLSYLPVKVGEPLDAVQMRKGIINAYGLGTLSSITYDVTGVDGAAEVDIKAYEKPHGPSYVQAGLTLSDDLKGNHESNLRAGLLFSPISRYGAEARVLLQLGSEPALTGEYYHPFDYRSRYVAEFRGGYETANFNLFDDFGNKVQRYRAERSGARALFSRNVSNALQLSLGLERFTGGARLEVGDPSNPDVDFDEGAALAQVGLDTIDSLYFPREGFLMAMGYRMSREGLGADTRFDQADFDAVGAKSFGAHAVQLGARYHVTTSGVAPFQSLYRLGGRWRLAGFQNNQLTGQNYALAFLGYSYQLGTVLGRSAQVGATIEYGNAWQRRSDMAWDDGIFNGSLFIGFDSWVGPLIFGYGMKEGGDGVIFIELGQSL
ncbi:patatin-like phospholipase family protein [Luteimonas sp. SX5]|uniref:Patatin-like phospholipase family protein n=1 Tax=Luteimonas galliterrae TaxID=2940486 RepID=A0ABT0MGG0_9GAMM|nr:patatin-like phospholipase family protein [Luteimonas galliterrae]MCL1633960.1 patatin-like phospholipase family protein [Luteimonas galliterrae]